MTRRSKTSVALFVPVGLLVASLLLPANSSAASGSAKSGSTASASAAAGRYKKGPDGGCYWDAKDTGPNQCTPPKKGRYKKDGDKCVWDANDTGPNQCTPPKPR